MPDQEAYRRHTVVTDPGAWRSSIDLDAASPRDIPSMVRTMVTHMDRAEDVEAERRRIEPQIMTVSAMLSRLHELTPGDRLIGHCRSSTVLGCSLLRELGIATRARVGYAAYYAEGRDFFGNHWVIEVWDTEQHRWRLVDAELDEATRERHGIDFDPDDVPRDQFIEAGRAWLDCRAGVAEWDTFGPYPERTGVTEAAAQLVRDVECLVGPEVGPFDSWLPERLTDAHCQVLDELAAASLDIADDVDRCVALRRAHPWICAPRS